MLPQLYFFVSIAFSFIAWGIVTARYIWPKLRRQCRADALRPLLVLHSFRFEGLAFLVPGVVSPDLPAAFAHSAAYGDFVAATLALLSLALLPRGAGIVLAWIFNLWGSADLLNAFYQANNAGLMAGQLRATYFIPTLFVPLLLITHGLGFWILLRRQSEFTMSKSWQPTGVAGEYR
jgi:membrane protein required for beta-lactamase induction